MPWRSTISALVRSHGFHPSRRPNIAPTSMDQLPGLFSFLLPGYPAAAVKSAEERRPLGMIAIHKRLGLYSTVHTILPHFIFLGTVGARRKWRLQAPPVFAAASPASYLP